MVDLAHFWGERLRQAREEAGLRQVDLAELTGLPQQRISSWESGSVTPRDAVKPIVARALGKDPNELFKFPAEEDNGEAA